VSSCLFIAYNDKYELNKLFYFILILGLWTDFLDYLKLYISLSKYIESFINVFGKNKSIQNEYLDQENKNLNFPITILPKIWEQASDTLAALFIKKILFAPFPNKKN